MPLTNTCTSCQQPLKELILEGHYGQSVSTDICGNCHLVWFDAFESVRLSGLGWVGLLREMMATPRAAQNLKAVRNLTRFGRTAALECEQGHGHYQGFALLLAERGLVRTLTTRDLAALQKDSVQPSCLNCGAPVEHVPTTLSGDTPLCNHCDTPLMLFDLPRLTQALLVRHGEELKMDAQQQPLAISCGGCGQPLDATQDTSCDTCGHVVAIPSLARIKPLLDQIEPILKLALPRQARPWGEKLQRMQGDASATQWHRVMEHAKDFFFSSRSSHYGDAHTVVNLIVSLAVLVLLYFIFG
jgi:hypothetical protein